MAVYTLSPGPVSPPIDVSWLDNTGAFRQHTVRGGETIVIDASELTVFTRRLIELRRLLDVAGTMRELPLTEGDAVGLPPESPWRAPVPEEADLPIVGDPLNTFRAVVANGQIYRHRATAGTVQEQWGVISIGSSIQPVTMVFPGETWVGAVVGTFQAPTACKVERVQISVIDDEPQGILALDLYRNNTNLEMAVELPNEDRFTDMVYETAPNFQVNDLLQFRVKTAARGNLSVVVLLQPVY